MADRMEVAPWFMIVALGVPVVARRLESNGARRPATGPPGRCTRHDRP